MRIVVFVAILLVVLVAVGFGLRAAIDGGGGEGAADLVPGAIAPADGGANLVVENDGKGDAGAFTDGREQPGGARLFPSAVRPAARQVGLLRA